MLNKKKKKNDKENRRYFTIINEKKKIIMICFLIGIIFLGIIMTLVGVSCGFNNKINKKDNIINLSTIKNSSLSYSANITDLNLVINDSFTTKLFYKITKDKDIENNIVKDLANYVLMEFILTDMSNNQKFDLINNVYPNNIVPINQLHDGFKIELSFRKNYIDYNNSNKYNYQISSLEIDNFNFISANKIDITKKNNNLVSDLKNGINNLPTTTKPKKLYEIVYTYIINNYNLAIYNIDVNKLIHNKNIIILLKYKINDKIINLDIDSNQNLILPYNYYFQIETKDSKYFLNGISDSYEINARIQNDPKQFHSFKFNESKINLPKDSLGDKLKIVISNLVLQWINLPCININILSEILNIEIIDRNNNIVNSDTHLIFNYMYTIYMSIQGNDDINFSNDILYGDNLENIFIYSE